MILGILLFVLSIFFVGYAILLLLSEKTPDLFSAVGLSWGLGISAVTLQMGLYGFLGLPWTELSLLGPWIVFCSGVLIYVRKKIPRVPKLPISQKPLMVFILLIFLAFLIVIVESQLHPVIAWDAIASWFLGGKAFYVDSGMNPSFIRFANNSTPPAVNLLIAYAYILMGEVNDTYVLIMYPIFYFCMLCIFYSLIRPFSTKFIAVFFVFLLATIPNIMRHAGRYDVGNADLPLAYFFLCSGLLFLSFLRTRSVRTLLLLNIFLGTGALIKSEGIPFLFIVQSLCFFHIIQWKEYSKALVLSIGLSLVLGWQVFKTACGLPGNPFIEGKPILSRLPVIAFEAVREFLHIGRWNLLWVTFFISVFFMIRKSPVRLIALICVLQILVYVSVYTTTFRDPSSHMRNSFDRLLLHIAPLTMYCIALSSTKTLQHVTSKFTKNK